MIRKILTKDKVGGISMVVIALPLIVLIAFMYVSMVVIIADINNSSNKAFDLVGKAGDYQMDATNIIANNTALSENCSAYILHPVTDDSDIYVPTEGSKTNYGPLMTYASEYYSDNRGPKVLERFKHYDVSPDSLLYVNYASEKSEQMIAIQIHAISVMDSVHPLPSIPELNTIPRVALTSQEHAMTAEERVKYAQNLLFGQKYTQLRFYVSENVKNCTNKINYNFNRRVTEVKDHIIAMRIVLWIEIVVLILILVGVVLLLHYLILNPMRKYAKDIFENKPIAKFGKMYEMRMLATAYNDMLEHHNKLENILRDEAEVDALTKLPNRYCFEHDVLEMENKSEPIAVLMFDINFLKKINDTKGHLAGDRAIRTSGCCIRECFKVKEDAKNCYRVGGDEFVVLLTNVSEEVVLRKVEKFRLATKRERVSVSVGYTWAATTNTKDIQKLMLEADKRMYEDKKRIHKFVEDKGLD